MNLLKATLALTALNTVGILGLLIESATSPAAAIVPSPVGTITEIQMTTPAHPAEPAPVDVVRVK